MMLNLIIELIFMRMQFDDIFYDCMNSTSSTLVNENNNNNNVEPVMEEFYGNDNVSNANGNNCTAIGFVDDNNDDDDTAIENRSSPPPPQHPPPVWFSSSSSSSSFLLMNNSNCFNDNELFRNNCGLAFVSTRETNNNSFISASLSIPTQQ